MLIARCDARNRSGSFHRRMARKHGRPDYRAGRGRATDPTLLAEFGRRRQFDDLRQAPANLFGTTFTHHVMSPDPTQIGTNRMDVVTQWQDSPPLIARCVQRPRRNPAD